MLSVKHTFGNTEMDYPRYHGDYWEPKVEMLVAEAYSPDGYLMNTMRPGPLETRRHTRTTTSAAK